MTTKTLIVLLLWFVAVFAAAHAGVFLNPPGRPPGAVGLAFGLPLLGFLLVFLGLPRFRAAASAVPPVLLVAVHGWRCVGMGFIMAYYHHLLPPGFAWPAGLGDMAVALAAPYIALRVARDPAYLASTPFWVWNLFGMADFIAAVGLGVAHQAAPQFFHASVTTGLMQELPFALIPCFFVPLIAMTHIIMVHQGRSQKLRFAAPHSPGLSPSLT